MQSDPVGLEGGENSFVYVGDNPLARVDESGLLPNALEATCPAGGFYNPICDAGIALDIATSIGIGLGVANAATSVAIKSKIDQLVKDLNSIKNKSRAVPYPPKKRGYWSAICRVDDQSPDNNTNFYDGTNIRRKYAFGYGIDITMTGARKKAEKMAKDILGSSNVHHPTCKCTSPTGVTGPCGR